MANQPRRYRGTQPEDSQVNFFFYHGVLRDAVEKLFLFCAVCLTLVACQSQPETIQIRGATMGTTWSVNLHTLPETIDPDKLKGQLQARLDRVNSLMSTYDPDSEISRFNVSTSGEWFDISAETAEVIALSLQISQMTDGAFDISVGPLVELWGFGARQRGEKLPSKEQVDDLLTSIGYQKLILRSDPPAIKKLHPQLQIDLSAIAKGYAVDLLAELLEAQQIDNFLVEVGGELQISGNRVDGVPWKIAIEKPDESVREVAKVFPLTGTALATSGNYRNFYIEDGQRYVHTIDPVSGYPISHRLASVTVLAKDCATADALATALMVMGEKRGREVVAKKKLATYMLIHGENETIEEASEEFSRFLQEVAQ